MNKYVACATAGLLAMAATGASAVSVTSPTESSGADTTIETTESGGNELSIDFAWESTPASGAVTFNTDSVFDVFFTSYTPRKLDGEFTGFVLERVGGARLSENRGACSGTAVASIAGNCDMIGGLDSTPPADNTPSSSDAIFSGLAAGDYVLGFDEDDKPESGAASFQVVERAAEIGAVPLPAGAFLLGSGLLGLGAFGRRRKKA